MPGEFYDVGADHLYHDEISRVVTAELMSGYEDGLFKPEAQSAGRSSPRSRSVSTTSRTRTTRSRW